MSRTLKSEHRSDGFHIGHRLERQARPAGRILAQVAEFLGNEFEDDDEPIVRFEPQVLSFGDEVGGMTLHTSSPCGGWCRRCLLHDDPGGCVG